MKTKARIKLKLRMAKANFLTSPMRTEGLFVIHSGEWLGALHNIDHSIVLNVKQ